MQPMSKFRECRSCYTHIGGLYAVNFFSYLVKMKYIEFINSSYFENSYQRLPLLLTEKGINYFKDFGEEFSCNGSAFACLDGTERLPHLSGKAGKSVFAYLLKSNLIYRKKDTRILIPSEYAKKFLNGNAGLTSDLIHD